MGRGHKNYVLTDRITVEAIRQQAEGLGMRGVRVEEKDNLPEGTVSFSARCDLPQWDAFENAMAGLGAE